MPHKDLETRRKYQREWVQSRRDAFFKGKSCVNCGSVDNLELDHINAHEKVSHRIFSWSKVRMEEELAKCQVLCRPCHIEKSKDEHPKGEDHYEARITPDDVRRIRNTKGDTKRLAEELNLHRRTVQRIRTGKLWSHI